MQASDLIPLDAPPRVRLADLKKWFGVTQNAIVCWVKKGRIPAPIRVGERTHWYDTEGIRAALKAEEAAGGPKRKKAVTT